MNQMNSPTNRGTNTRTGSPRPRVASSQGTVSRGARPSRSPAGAGGRRRGGGGAGGGTSSPRQGGGTGHVRNERGRSGGGPRGERNSSFRRERSQSEYDQQILAIRRVTRVVAGGRRFSFSVALVIGNRKGSVGVGIGKASDTSLAIEKAVRVARKALVKLRLTKDMSIPCNIGAKFSSARVRLMPAPGKGIVAGSSVRSVLELAGVRDVTAKVLSRSKNKYNNALATMQALKDAERSK